MVELQTARLLLRRWHDDDLERLVALFSDREWRGFLERVSYLWLVQWVKADQRADDAEVSSRMSARRG